MAGRFNSIENIREYVDAGNHLAGVHLEDAILTIVDAMIAQRVTATAAIATVQTLAQGADAAARTNAGAIAALANRLKAAGIP